MADLARVDHEIQRSMVEAMMDIRKVEAQIAKTDAQVELAERKMALQERMTRAQVRAQAQRKEDGD